MSYKLCVVKWFNSATNMSSTSPNARGCSKVYISLRNIWQPKYAHSMRKIRIKDLRFTNLKLLTMT